MFKCLKIIKKILELFNQYFTLIQMTKPGQQSFPNDPEPNNKVMTSKDLSEVMRVRET